MKYAVVVALTLIAAAPEENPDWSRFRGPNGTGIATVTGLPTEFGPVTLKWKLADDGTTLWVEYTPKFRRARR